ncbi:serine hydrolase domain-containing protein [Microbulbifer pacificus]|uniref:Serine hydrolase n=1 Tax=Microbulbifer pacificus TaxID=407164 RepID=A0AAU0MZL8_9GAMM|nr:serine hydrolase [Microbulbifer pacificus]WOX05553.1 serine hydrolase [Microbulbifer pacificus]
MSISFYLLASISVVILLVASVWIWRRSLARRYRALRESLQVLIAMSAKLACSARHLSGFNDTRIRHDLLSYSPLFTLVRVRHSGYTTSASLLNCITAFAHFYPSLGTQLESQNPEKCRGIEAQEASGRPREKKGKKYTKGSLQTLLSALIREDNRLGFETRALLVIHEGQLMAAAYGTGIAPHTRLLGWSMSKSLLAILWGRMETLGLADIHQSRLFPEWEDDGRCTITLKNLLQMCDGLAFDETYRPGSDATRMLFGNGDCPSLYAPSRYALERPLTHKPGMYFSYSSGSTNLLARWMHQYLGSSEASAHFLQQELLAPLGLHRTFFEMDSDGVFVGSSYAYASAEDWGRLGALMLNDGCVGAQRILSSDWIRRAAEPNSSANDSRYGYQFWLNYGGKLPPLYPQLPPDSYFMLGNREQKLMLSPAHDTVIVRLGWSSTPYPIERRFGEILAQMRM